jgi:hypothetical protein
VLDSCLTRYKASGTSLVCERCDGGSVGAMKKNLRGGLGVLLVVVGLIWTLQGLGYVAGSVMTGVTFWAIVGPIVAIIGAFLVAGAVRARR